MSEEKESKHPFKKTEEKQKEWPSEVMERFQMQAERIGDDVHKVVEAFTKHIDDEYGCEDWQKEDADLLIDWSEMMFMEDRKSNVSGGGGETLTFVGEWLGVEDKSNDRNGWSVRNATQKWNDDPNEALSSGIVGHYYTEGSVWCISTSEKQIVTEESADEEPIMGFKVGDDWLCLLSKAGRPYPATRMGRYYRFLGNEKGAFLNKGDIKVWRVDLTGENRNLKIHTGVPVEIQVRLPTTTNEAFQDILGTNFNFAETMKYGDEWCPESEKALLNPFKLWTDEELVGDIYVPLHELDETYESRKRHFKGRDGNDGTIGPDVIVKGRVTRMSTDGRESDWDETGRNFSLSITSKGLEDTYGTKNQSEISCWVSGACHDLSHPFHFIDVDDELWGFAEKSTVLVHGRLKIRVNDGVRLPQITVWGIYADNKRSRRRVGGGDTDSTQFD